MNFYTPQRMLNESFESYKSRQKEQKHYAKRGCYFYVNRFVKKANGRIVGVPYQKGVVK